MKDKKIVLFLAFRNVVPADFENWMEKMAADGWYVDHVGQWSSLLITFKRGIPKKYRYIYDIQVFPRKDYISSYEQFGWEYLGCMASAYIWRKEYEDERPEVFSDSDSILERNKRVISAVSVSFTIFLVSSIAFLLSTFLFSKSMSSSDIFQIRIVVVMTIIFTILLGCVMLKIKRNKNR